MPYSFVPSVRNLKLSCMDDNSVYTRDCLRDSLNNCTQPFSNIRSLIIVACTNRYLVIHGENHSIDLQFLCMGIEETESRERKYCTSV